jgi:hypothetical protein
VAWRAAINQVRDHHNLRDRLADTDVDICFHSPNTGWHVLYFRAQGLARLTGVYSQSDASTAEQGSGWGIWRT